MFGRRSRLPLDLGSPLDLDLIPIVKAGVHITYILLVLVAKQGWIPCLWNDSPVRAKGWSLSGDLIRILVSPVVSQQERHGLQDHCMCI